ncbi:unnamed protein product [Symbiodinium sp. CCMP2592]|nr:unnamed protein product [Symbiodinium sp. CCMP2592]
MQNASHTAMEPCLALDSWILDPYENAGQHVGSIISFWSMSLLMLLHLGAVARSIRKDGTTRWVPVLLTTFFFCSFVSGILQAVAHSFSTGTTKTHLLLTARLWLGFAAGTCLFLGTSMGEALMAGKRELAAIRSLSWVFFVFGTGASVFALALASDGDDFVQAGVMSAAFLWADAFWIATCRKMQREGTLQEKSILLPKLGGPILMALAFWILASLEPTCGAKGHSDCYKSCPVGGPGAGPGLPHVFFVGFFVFGKLSQVLETAASGQIYIARDLESLAVAFATAQIRADSLYEAIARRSRTMLTDFNSLDLANMAVALRKASWEDPDLMCDIARHAIPQLRAGNAPSQALVDFAWSFRALPVANLQDFWTAWSSEVLRKMSRHDLRHLVALEALSPAPTRATVGQQLGRVLYRLLRVLPQTPSDWFGEDYSNLLRGLRIADLGAAATTFFLSQLGLAVTFQATSTLILRALFAGRVNLVIALFSTTEPKAANAAAKLRFCHSADSREAGVPGYSLHGQPERVICKEEAAKLSRLQSTWLSPVRHLRAGPVVDRTQCCLFQVLEDLAPVAANLKDAPRLRIVGDGTPCVSCVGALAQLRQHLPDLEIEVTLKPRLRQEG